MARKSYVGVDIGTSSIKITQLEDYRGQPKLTTYGYAHATIDIMRDSSVELQNGVAQLIAQVMQRAGVTTNQCIAALPTFAVFNSIISLPRMSRRDLATAIKWEAKKFIPLPIDDMILDWKLLDGAEEKMSDIFTSKNLGSLFKKKQNPADAQKQAAEDAAKGKEEQKNLRILLTAAPKTLVGRYVEIFKLAGLKLLSLETEAFALSRSLLGVAQETVMIVDIGSTATDICLIEKGVPILNRGLDSGGFNITKSISDSLNVNADRAEQFKLDFGIKMQGQQSAIPDAIKDSLQPIINEIQYVFELYQNQGSLKVGRILLSGGSAFLPNFPEYLSQLLKIPVYIGNPWDRVIYPLDLKPVLESIGPQMAVSIGLAMRNITH